MNIYLTAILPILFALTFTLGFEFGANTLEARAISRGYALYCPTDGEYAWKNECRDGE